jgi:hypothetical protein
MNSTSAGTNGASVLTLDLDALPGIPLRPAGEGGVASVRRHLQAPSMLGQDAFNCTLQTQRLLSGATVCLVRVQPEADGLFKVVLPSC